MRALFKQLNDQELARMVADCDLRADSAREAFDEIVERYCKVLSQFALSRLGSVQDAEDIVQETFLKAYRNIGSFDGRNTLRNWLFTIAYRLIVSAYRKKRPEELSQEAEETLAASEGESSDGIWLWQQAAKLSGDSFTVLWLRYKQDMSIEDIARIMNKSKLTVRVLLHRSRERLAKAIRNNVDLAEELPWLFSGKLSVNGSQS